MVGNRLRKVWAFLYECYIDWKVIRIKQIDSKIF